MSRGTSIAELRRAAQQAVAASSLRAVAEDVGLTAPGLKGFLDGAAPRKATIAKLVIWSRSKPGGNRLVLQAEMRLSIGVVTEYILAANSSEGREKRLKEALLALADQLPQGTRARLMRALT